MKLKTEKYIFLGNPMRMGYHILYKYHFWNKWKYVETSDGGLKEFNDRDLYSVINKGKSYDEENY